MSLQTGHESVYVEGSGPLVVLLHGGPGMNAKSISPVSRLLRDDFCVVRYDQHRAPGSAGTILSTQTLIWQIEELRQHFGAESLLLLGHSWGAGLAALYANAYPANVDGLVLVHPMEISGEHLAVSQMEMERRRPWKDIRRCWKIARQLRRLSRDDIRRESLEEEQLRLDFRLTCADAPYGLPLQSFDLGNYDWRAAEAIWQDLEITWPSFSKGGYDLGPVFHNLQSPVQVISGKYDVIDRRSTRRIAEITKAQSLSMERSGHWSFLEQPEEFKAAVSQFLQECHPRSAGSKKASETAIPAKAFVAAH